MFMADAKPKEKKKAIKAYKSGRQCPKCGRRMAEHKNRFSCGKCGYAEFVTAEKK